jgi:hypothetical protein
MSIQFDTDQVQYKSRSVLGQAQIPGMAAWLMKKGIIKEEAQAGGVLVGIVCMNCILIGLVLYFFVF